MRIRSTVHPGKRGAKRLLSQYGDRLVWVRYRYDEQRQRRVKTVELIVEEAEWAPPRAQPPKDGLVPIRLAPPEVRLRKCVKQCGGRWDPQRGVWELSYKHVSALGLEARIVDSRGL
jgi:hypothetical protein